MKPFRIFIFFVVVLLLLSIIALLMPEQGIGVTGDLRLSFLSVSDLFREDTLKMNKSVERLMAGATVTDDPESDPEEDLARTDDTGGEVPQPVVTPANADSLKQSVFRLQFAEGEEDLLAPFFRTLGGLRNGSVVRTRILHFGDSQIEDDRMTALIRYRLQQYFGGSGTGLVPAIPIFSGHMAYEQDQEGEWLRYTFFGKRDSTIRHNSYGVMGAFASVPIAEDADWPLLHFRFNTSRRTGRFNRIRIFLHSYVDKASIAFQVNDTITDTLKHIPDGFSVADYRHHGAVKDLKVHLDLPEGGRIYGISFESDGGLQVDNIAMRGGSGLIFTKMNRGQQKAMLDHLSPGLIMLQFGGNVVPYMNSGYYQRAFKRELQFIKEICPGTPVIVIGPSDMSIKERGVFKTYPTIEPIRDALKNAALDSGFAFWDLYTAMGGYNSMPSFVHADPPLASTDYVHFTALGVNLVAEMFYNALMLEYNNFHLKI
ncbi:MAG: hypothetical protein KAR19_05110 [Bacteroidales bacterium]|nr:hypothetical protein [Bacteroidales bacterium]